MPWNLSRSKGDWYRMPSIRLRKAEQPPSHDYGTPPRPKGLARATRNAWTSLVAELLAARVLRQDDAALLLELIQCRADQYKAAGQRRGEAKARADEIMAGFMARQPQPLPAPDAPPDAPTVAK